MSGTSTLPRHFKTLIKIPGFNHQEIGTKFIDLIDEGFKMKVLKTTLYSNKPKTFMSSSLAHPSFNQKLNLPFIH
jgi:hypothetical protein